MALSNRFIMLASALVTTAVSIASAAAPLRSLSRGAQEVMAEEADLYFAKRTENGRNLRASNQFQLDGAFELIGAVSAAQVFSRGKLIPCTINRDSETNVIVAARISCDDSKRVYLPLSDGTTTPATPVAPGLYILGYENSIHPGYVMVAPGQTTRVILQQIPVPSGGTVKIFRDLTSVEEQRKIYFTTFLTGKSFFKFGEWSFGDLYLQKLGNMNAPPNLDYTFCEQPALPELTSRGERICRAWNQGSFMGLMEMFDFRNDARFYQWEVRKPGKPYAYRFNRLLVAKATTSTRAQHVNVLAGIYGVEVVDAKGVVKTLPPVRVGLMDATTGALVTTYGMLPRPEVLALNGPVQQPRPVAAIDPINDPLVAQSGGLSPEGDEPTLQPGENCASAKMWRTELRSHCKADTQDGCARATARLCEPMVVDLQ